jgi:LAO/AO transport system kinase
VLAGERLALARLLSAVENDTPAGREALDQLYPHAGKAHLVGVTGAPGTGKSSLVNKLVSAIRAAGFKVAVIAVDPSSPFTGGALLGDRLRMKDAVGDMGVFIRSMASRGALGGLARTTAAASSVFDAAGYAFVLIETVGSGQNEVEIARLAHTVIVVDAPGLGDDIQAGKAGILEIADILVVNKADLPGAENTLRALNGMLEIAYAHDHPDRWRPALLRASAANGEGIAEIYSAVLAHGEFLQRTGGWQRREQDRLRAEFEALLRDRLWQRWQAQQGSERLEDAMRRVAERQVTPYAALNEVLSEES